MGEVIATVSVIVNAGMLVYVMRTPIKVWSTLHKALIFCFLWAGCGLTRTAINMLLPVEAPDVKDIEDANHRFIRSLRRETALKRRNSQANSYHDPGSVPVPLYKSGIASASAVVHPLYIQCHLYK